jgi:hypothetical protein
MTDRAAALARCLTEQCIPFPVGPDGKVVPGAIRAFIDQRFPGLTQEERTRGFMIAVEIAKADRGLR